jgi:ABC-type nitrate/sulfonate/bicarbonate transport system permease component
MNNKIKGLIYSLLALFIIFFMWQAISWLVLFTRGVDFPTPFETINRFLKNCTGERIYDYSIWKHVFYSIFRWLTGYLFAVIFGVLIGFLLGTNQTLNRLFIPFINVLQLIPGLAWIPIALLLFGLGNISTIFMIFIIAFSPIVLITSSGIKNTPSDLIHAAQIMGATRKKIFIHVLFPSALFNIVDAMRIGLANSWRVLIAAEMIVGTGVGLGYIIIQSRWTLDYTSAFVSILVIVFIGLTVEKFIFNRIENKLREKYGKEFSSGNITYK